MVNPTRIFSILAISLVTGLSALQTQPPGGFRADFLRQLDDVEQKVTALAKVIPQEKYSWRPGPGVRSISEVFMHIASANYMFPSMAGVRPPAGMSRDLETRVTEKAIVLEWLQKSFAHMRAAMLATEDRDLDKPVKMFGQDTTIRNVFFTAAMHMHEHLGQSIAYARTNGIVPPWSE